MYDVMAASRPRCLVVAIGLTAALWGVAGVLAGALTAGLPAGQAVTPDQALVRLSEAVLVAAVAWAWLQGLAGVADAWRGRPAPAGRSGIRRLALVACGVALVGALTAPAQAGVDRPRPGVLSGLPLPERAEGPAHPATRSVVVRRGDTLWAIAERDLPADAGAEEISERWHAVYRRNRGVVGPDPDLIRPGQVLKLTKERT
jgi:nucleoid-associated protein YgaU